MRTGKIVALVVGILLVLTALALLVPGGVLLGLYGTQRNSDGYFQTSSRVLSTNGSALVTPNVELNMGPLAGRWLPTGDRAAIRIEATGSGSDRLFVAIGPSSDVSQYLKGVDYDEVTDFGWGWTSVRYRHMDGALPASPPGEQRFWAAEGQGAGTTTLDWDVEDGNWTVVVMNADGSAPVTAEVSLGARFDFLLSIGVGITVAGVVLLGVGILLIVIGARRPTTPVVAASPAASAEQPPAPQPPQSPSDSQ